MSGVPAVRLVGEVHSIGYHPPHHYHHLTLGYPYPGFFHHIYSSLSLSNFRVSLPWLLSSQHRVYSSLPFSNLRVSLICVVIALGTCFAFLSTHHRVDHDDDVDLDHDHQHYDNEGARVRNRAKLR